ncbi:MAG TPA: hypothetical protein VF048_04705 [Gemmatimonadaceae bacterium]
MASAPLLWLSMLRLLAALLAGGGIAAVVAHAPGAAPRAYAEAARDLSRDGIGSAAPTLPGAIWDRVPGQLGAGLRATGAQWDGGARGTPPVTGGAARPGGATLPAPHPTRATRRATLVLADLRTHHAATPRLGAAHHYPTAPPSGR